jgi:hypothetical protein
LPWAAAACSTIRPASAGCRASIELRRGGAGPEIGDPTKLVCAPGEQLNVSFVNHDNGNRPFEITIVGCESDKNSGKNPVADFVGRPINVLSGQARKLAGGWWIFSWTPTMRSIDEIKALACSSTPSTAYLFSYTIRANGAPDKGSQPRGLAPRGLQ